MAGDAVIWTYEMRKAASEKMRAIRASAWERWNNVIVPAIEQYMNRQWSVFVLPRCPDHKNVDKLSSFLSTMDQLKLGELLESPESPVDHNVIGNDERDGNKNNGDWAISSQAFEGKGSREGSTTRQMSPNNNSAHECRGTET